MFLSRVELHGRAVAGGAFWREVAKPYGAHQALWRLLSTSPDQPRDFLFRAEESGGRPTFLILSKASPPADGGGMWKVETKPFAPLLRPGQRLGFRLRVSPVVSRAPPGAGNGARGHRHDVIMDRKRQLKAAGKVVGDETEVVREAGTAWLVRQGEKSGFRPATAALDVIGDDGLLEAQPAAQPAVRVDGYRQHRIVRKGETAITFSSADFEGVLEVTDPEAFLRRVCSGFGPQKAFGMGLMLLRRA